MAVHISGSVSGQRDGGAAGTGSFSSSAVRTRVKPRPPPPAVPGMQTADTKAAAARRFRL